MASGVFVYAVLNGLVGIVVFVSRGYIEPSEYDLKEYWTWKGSGRAPWFVRAIRRRQNPSEDEDDHAPGLDLAMTDLNYAERRDHSSSTTAASTGKDEPQMSPPPDRWVR